MNRSAAYRAYREKHYPSERRRGMRFFWRFRKRYGMKAYYSGYEEFHRDFVRVFGKQPEGQYVSFGRTRVHVDPRGKCGDRGKVLCYRKIGKSFYYLYKHRKTVIGCDVLYISERRGTGLSL